MAKASAADLDELEALVDAEDEATEFSTPGALAFRLDPSTRNPTHLRLLDKALVDVAEGRCDRLIIVMPPQEGKSERASRRFPLWLLHRNQEMRIAVVSYEDEAARRWGRYIRNDLIGTVENPDYPDLGLRLQEDSKAAGRWNVAGHRGSVYCVGWRGPLTGQPVDVLVIDDPIKDRKDADSAATREDLWEWWTDVARTRLAPGAAVVLILTRWHEDDLAGRLMAEEPDRWRVLRIPAAADHDPSKGETDPVGREPGEYLDSARGPGRARDFDEVKAKRARTWQALYQGRPAPAEGTILLRGWWRYYEAPRTWRVVEHGPDQGQQYVRASSRVIASWDMSFKDLSSSSFVVGQVWELVPDEARAYLLDQTRARMDFPTTCAAVEQQKARWPQIGAILVEDKANGTAVVASLQLKVPGLIAEPVHGSKPERAAAVAPFVKAGNVYLPAPGLAPWVGELVEEAAGFPNAAHDDQVDALSQALARLFLPVPVKGSRHVVETRQWSILPW